jgi:hypothetical protein
LVRNEICRIQLLLRDESDSVCDLEGRREGGPSYLVIHTMLGKTMGKKKSDSLQSSSQSIAQVKNAVNFFAAETDMDVG